MAVAVTTNTVAQTTAGATRVTVSGLTQPAAGSNIIAFIGIGNNSNTVSSVTGAGCSSWALLGTRKVGTTRTLEVWIGYNCDGTTNANVVVTCASSSAIVARIVEVTGMAHSGALDGTQVDNGPTTSATASYGSITPGDVGDAIFGFTVLDSSGSQTMTTPPTGWTGIGATSGGTAVRVRGWYIIPGSVAAQSGTAAISSSTEWSTITMALRAATSTLQPTGISRTPAVGSAAIKQTISPTGISRTPTVGSAVVTGQQTINQSGASTYSSSVIALSPAAYYHLADLADSSGNARNLTDPNSGGATLGDTASDLIDYDSGSGATISISNANANTAYVDVPTSTGAEGLNTNAWTFAAWILPTGSLNSGVLARSQTSAGSLKWEVKMSSGSAGIITVRVIRNAVGTTTVTTSGGPAYAGRPIFVAATYDGATIRVYINGVEYANAADTGSAGATASQIHLFGAPGSGNNPLAGRYDEIALWSSALSAANIASLYALGARSLRSGAYIGAGYVGGDIATVKSVASVLPSGLASTAVVGSHTVTGGTSTQTVSPTGISRTPVLGSLTVTSLARILPTGIGGTSTTGSLTVTSVVNILPAGISRTPVLGSSVVTSVVNVLPSSINRTPTAGLLTVTTLATILPGGISRTPTTGLPVVTSLVSILPSGVSRTPVLGSLTITTLATILPSGINSTVVVGSALVNNRNTILPGGQGSTAAIGSLTITSIAYIRPSGLASTVVVGSAKINFTLLLVGITSTKATGTPTVIPGVVLILPAGITSTTTVGQVKVNLTVFMIGIASTAIPGQPKLNLVVFLAGITSTHVVGNGLVNSTALINPTGIASTSTIGAPVLRSQARVVPGGINSSVAVGSLRIVLYLLPTGISRTPTMGGPNLVFGLQIGPTGIPRSSAVGVPKLMVSFIVKEPTGVLLTHATIKYQVELTNQGITSSVIVNSRFVAQLTNTGTTDAKVIPNRATTAKLIT